MQMFSLFCVRCDICIFSGPFPFHLSCQLYWFKSAHNFPKLMCRHMEARQIGDHFMLYKNIESLCCTLETNIVYQL